MIVASMQGPDLDGFLILLTDQELDDLRDRRGVSWPMEPAKPAVMVMASPTEADGLAVLQEHVARIVDERRPR